MLYSLGERVPQVHPTAYVAPGATLIGSVILEAHASVWPGAVIRADQEVIHVGPRSNIQDGAVLHADPGFPLIIGAEVTVGHLAMLHGCRIADHCLIGIGAVVLNGATLGADVLVGARALVTGATTIESGQVVVGAPAKVVRRVTEGDLAAIDEGARHYVEHAARYPALLREVSRQS